MEAHVVCKECGTRWMAADQPRRCVNPECAAGWMDLPMFADGADADRAAERVLPDGTVVDGLGNFRGIDQPAAAVALAQALDDIASGDWRRYPNSEYHRCGTVEDFARWALADAAKEAAAVREP